MTYKGIDISSWQPDVDYTKVSQDIDFVILREGYRKAIDQTFIKHVNGFRNNNVPILAVYHFIYALNNDDAAAEAKSCIANVEKAGLGKDVMIFADFEYDTVQQAADAGVTLTSRECNSFTKLFCEEIEKAGYKAGIYTNLDYYEHWYYKATVESYPLWLAMYPYTPPTFDTKQPKDCLIWQYSSTGKVDGIYGNVDMDFFYGELDDVQKVDDKKEGDVAMTKVEKAIQWMEDMARDDSHGYDQIYRWGEKGDYDCSSAVITAYEVAGIPVKTKGATFTGNMYSVFTQCGFKDVTNQINLETGVGLVRGDVLLNDTHHTAMYCGNGLEVEASINEKGTATYGTPGDQTTREFLIRPYRNYPWQHILRYEESSESTTAEVPEVKTDNPISEEPKYKAKVTASSLNVRTWAGTENSTVSFSPLPKGTVVEVCDSRTASDGSKWFFIKYNGKFGFVSSAYLEKTEDDTPITPVVEEPPITDVPIDPVDVTDGMAKAGTINSLVTVKTDAGFGYMNASSSTLSKADRIKILDTKTGSDGKQWYKVEYTKTGYIPGNYVDIDK